MKTTAARLAAAGTAGALLALFTPLAASAPGATAGTSPAITLTGSAGNLPARSGVLLVEAELVFGRNTNSAYVAATLVDIFVASEHITGGRY